MSELITAQNLELVIEKNHEIKEEVLAQAIRLQTNPSIMKVASAPQLALLILQGFGLIQMPIEDKYWSGAIFVKDEKIIPVINTALPRANQYFTAWHEIYHLIFDKVSFDHFIETDNTLEERKAEYFAACMLLNGVDRYFTELTETEFVSKVFRCMSTFQAPYKAVLVSLYEYAIQSENEKLCGKIKEVFDLQFDDLPNRFRMLGLDDSLVCPSYVINTSSLQEKIKRTRDENPELRYHEDNEDYLKKLKLDDNRTNIEQVKEMYDEIREDSRDENEALMETANLSLEILSDLQGDNDKTKVNPPIKDEEWPEGIKDNKFYSNTYKFSKKDFEDKKVENIQEDFYDDEMEDEKSNSKFFFKIILLIFGISLVGVIIVYLFNYFNRV